MSGPKTSAPERIYAYFFTPEGEVYSASEREIPTDVEYIRADLTELPTLEVEGYFGEHASAWMDPRTKLISSTGGGSYTVPLYPRIAGERVEGWLTWGHGGWDFDENGLARAGVPGPCSVPVTLLVNEPGWRDG